MLITQTINWLVESLITLTQSSPCRPSKQLIRSVQVNALESKDLIYGTFCHCSGLLLSRQCMQRKMKDWELSAGLNLRRALCPSLCVLITSSLLSLLCSRGYDLESHQCQLQSKKQQGFVQAKSKMCPLPLLICTVLITYLSLRPQEDIIQSHIIASYQQITFALFCLSNL